MSGFCFLVFRFANLISLSFQQFVSLYINERFNDSRRISFRIPYQLKQTVSAALM